MNSDFLKHLWRYRNAVIWPMLGLFITFSYFHFSKPSEDNNTSFKAIAFVKSIDGTHYLKAQNSDLWVPLQEGDQLGSGEKIKTGTLGEVKIQFVGGNSTLEIEADTEVEINQKSNINVFTIIEGNLVLTAEDNLQFSIDENNSSSVLPKGKVTIRKEKNQKLQINPKDILKESNFFNISWTGISDDFEIQMNPEDPVPQEFTWESDRNDIDIALEWGPSRKKLTQLEKVSADKKSMKIVFPLGKHYFRWSVFEKSKPTPEWSSKTAKALVQGKFPPAIVSPISGQAIKSLDNKMQFELKWMPHTRFTKYKLELAQDEQFKKVILTKEFETQDSYTFKDAIFGNYWWRLSGFDHKGNEWIRSKAHPFKFQKKETEKVILKWTTLGDGPLKYLTPEPSATLKWSTDQARAVSYYITRVSSPIEDLKSAKGSKSTSPEVIINLPRPGLYRGQVDAYNNEDEIIGQTNILNFEAQPFPKLRAPAVSNLPAVLQANNRGQLNITWQKVEGAKQYQIELKAYDQAPQFYLSKENKYSFQKLMPGTYELRILALDESGRTGDLSERRQVLVPNISSIKPIKVRKVEVQ